MWLKLLSGKTSILGDHDVGFYLFGAFSDSVNAQWHDLPVELSIFQLQPGSTAGEIRRLSHYDTTDKI